MTSISPCSPPVVTRDAKAYYNALTALLAKSDGRDKFLAAIQFVAMYGAAGQAGHLSNIAKNLGGARKPFRVLKPMEVLVGLLTSSPGKGPLLLRLLDKLKMLGFLAYFTGDHLVWGSSIGLIKDPIISQNAAKVSMYGWLTASLATLVSESFALAKTEKTAHKVSQGELRDKRTKHCLVLAQNSCQVCVAGGALGFVKLSPRQIAACGVAMSLINLYFMCPPLPPAVKPKDA